MITAHYINPLYQYGQHSYDLIITSDSGDQLIRLNKAFPSTADRAGYVDFANFVIQEFLQLESSVSDVTIDTPAGA